MNTNQSKSILNSYDNNKRDLKLDGYYNYAIILLIGYELLIRIIAPANGSLLKLIISIFFIASFFSLAMYFYNSIHNIRRAFKPIYFIFILLLNLGIFNIIRSFKADDQSLITLFGNKDTGLAMLLPMAMILGFRLKNLIWFNQLCLKMLKFGLLILPFWILDNAFFDLATYLFGFYLIPLSLFVYQDKNGKLIVVLATFCLVILGIYFGGRLTALQILFLWAGNLIFYLSIILKVKYVKRLIIICLVSFPFIIMLTDFQIFKYVSKTQDVKVGESTTTDTRTFLYAEVINDLKKTETLIFGKGALGTYYSPYFAQNVKGGDDKNRINVEVGLLSMLLKGGILNASLNFIILFTALISAYQANNKFTTRLSFLVVCHLLSLFISDMPQYTTLSFSNWIAIGGCISLYYRKLSEQDILLLFKHGSATHTPKNYNHNPVLQSRPIY